MKDAKLISTFVEFLKKFDYYSYYDFRDLHFYVSPEQDWITGKNSYSFFLQNRGTHEIGEEDVVNILEILERDSKNPRLNKENYFLFCKGKDQSAQAGFKDKENKPNVALLPSLALLETARAMTLGLQTYPVDNWRKGLPWSDIYAAAMRHLLKWHSGKDIDEKSNLLHLSHASSNLLILLEFSLRDQYREFDDRPKDRR